LRTRAQLDAALRANPPAPVELTALRGQHRVVVELTGSGG
jgi:hypothetical protein